MGNTWRLEDYIFDVALALGLLVGSKSPATCKAIRMLPIRIVIMAKAPVAGFAKTRLIPALGAQGAASLAQNMLRHTVHAALAARLGVVEICATPDVADSAWQNLALNDQLCWTSQGDGDLGERMARAASRTRPARSGSRAAPTPAS